MTDAAAPVPPDAPRATTLYRPAASASRPLVWGALLTGLAMALLYAGLTSTSGLDGGPDSTFVGLSIIVAMAGLPMLLIGVIAVGVRIGLEDRVLLREWDDLPDVEAR